MTDIRELADLRELDPVEMAGVLGGDGVLIPGRPVYIPPPPMKYPEVKPKPMYEM
jgi:hypothetical protein